VESQPGLKTQLAIGLPIGLASVVVHGSLDYVDGPIGHRLLALAIFLTTVAFGGWMVAVTPRRPPGTGVRRWSRLAVISVLIAGLAVFLVGLLRLPPWSEEAWWILIARRAWHLQIVHPMGVKSDFPSNFQFWPIAALLPLTGNPHLAARLPGVAYGVAAAFFTAATVRCFVTRFTLPLAACFPLCSLWMVFLVHSGWSDVNVVPVLIAAQTYLLCRSVLDRDERSLMALGVVCGVGFWTLYTPFMYSLIVVGMALVLAAGKRTAIRFLLTWGVVISATVGKLLQWPSLLQRHLRLLEGGEFHSGQGVAGLVAAYWDNLVSVAKACLPACGEITWLGLGGIWLEASTSVLLVVGLAAGWWGIDRLRRLLLYAPAGLALAGLVISHGQPSPWRATVLAAPIFLLAGVGAHRMTEAASRLLSTLDRRRTAAVSAAIILVLHVMVFTGVRIRYRSTHLDHNDVGWLAIRVYDIYGARMVNMPTVVVGSPLLGVFLDNLADGGVARVPGDDLDAVMAGLREEPEVLVTVSDADGEDAVAEGIEGKLDETGRPHAVDKITDPRGRVASVFLLGSKSKPTIIPLERPVDPPKTAACIAVGSELLGEDRLDSNSLTITTTLARFGIEVVEKRVIGDSVERLAAAVAELFDRVDVVMLTGGLGPTADDITREAVASALGRQLERDADLLRWIEERYAAYGREMPALCTKMADVVSGSRPLVNDRGAAPGILLRDGGKLLVALPGVPWEMEDMLAGDVAGELEAWSGGVQRTSRVLVLGGVYESAIEERIEHLYQRFGRQQITILAKCGVVRLVMTAAGDAISAARGLDEMEREFRRVLGDDVAGVDVAGIEEIVLDLLRGRGETLAAAESCTGGMLGARLTEVPGASDVFVGGIVSYSNDVKRRIVGVPDDLLIGYGAVSAEVARAMAEGVRDRLDADWGIGITGVAGPGGGSEEKPVGSVYWAVASKRGATIRHQVFPGTRGVIRLWSVQSSLDTLRRIAL